MRNKVFVYVEIHSVYLEIYDYGVLVQPDGGADATCDGPDTEAPRRRARSPVPVPGAGGPGLDCLGSLALQPGRPRTYRVAFHHPRGASTARSTVAAPGKGRRAKKECRTYKIL